LETADHYRTSKTPMEDRHKTMRGIVSKKRLLNLIAKAGSEPLTDDELDSK
jgi:hypothetical protein